MARLGAVIRMGAEGHTLVLNGARFDLNVLDRHQTRALASTLSDALGLQERPPTSNSRHRRSNRSK